MPKFAKLIELKEEEQVLLTIDFSDEDDVYEVSIRTDVNGMSASAKLGFKEEQKAKDMMKSYAPEDAKKFREQMVVLLT